MAKVPTSVPTVDPTLGPTVFQNIQASPDAFGAAQGRAAAQIGAQTQQFAGQQLDIAARNQIQDNIRENKLAQIRLNTELSAIEQEYKNLNGEDAVKRLDEFRARSEEAKVVIALELSNEKVAEMFGFDSAGASLGTSERMQNHQRTQRDVAEFAADQAAINEGNDRAINAFEDVEEVDLASEQVRISAETKALRDGFSDAVAKSKGEEAAGKAVLGSIQAAVAANNLTHAETLFERYTSSKVLEGEDKIKARLLINSAIGTNKHKRTAEARDIITAIDNGDTVRTPEQIQDILADLRAGGSDSELDAANDLERKAEAQIKTKEVVRNATLSEQERFLEEIEAISGPITDQQSVTKEYYGKQVALGRKARASGNLIDLYSQRYDVDKPPIDFNSVESLSRRNTYAQEASDALGEPVSPLNKQETENLELQLSGEQNAQGTITTAQQAANMMANLHEAFGGRQTGAIAARMTKENRATALALVKSADDIRLASQIIRGGRLRKDPALRAKLGTAATRNVAFDEVLGGMQSSPSGIQSAIIAAAEAHYLDNNPNVSEFDDELFKESVAAVVGGVVEQEGNSIPTYAPGVGQDRFDYVINKLTSDMFPDTSFFIQNDEGNPIEYNIELLDQSFFNPADNPQLRPKGLTGKYTIQMPDGRFILDADGNAAIIDMRRIDALIPNRRRVATRGTEGFSESDRFVDPRILNKEFDALRERVSNVQTQPNVSPVGLVPTPFSTEEDLSDLNVTPDTTIEGRTFLNQSLSQIFGDTSKQQVITDRLKLQENSQQKGRSSTGIWKQHLDPKGFSTIGYGHLLTKDEKSSGLIEIDSTTVAWRSDGLTDAQVNTLLQQDIVLHGEIASRSVSNWSNLNNARKSAVLDMAFGLGENKLDKFHNSSGTGTLDFIENGQWIAAARSLLKNKGLFNERRRLNLAQMLITGRFQND